MPIVRSVPENGTSTSPNRNGDSETMRTAAGASGLPTWTTPTPSSCTSTPVVRTRSPCASTVPRARASGVVGDRRTVTSSRRALPSRRGPGTPASVPPTCTCAPTRPPTATPLGNRIGKRAASSSPSRRSASAVRATSSRSRVAWPPSRATRPVVRTATSVTVTAVPSTSKRPPAGSASGAGHAPARTTRSRVTRNAPTPRGRTSASWTADPNPERRWRSSRIAATAAASARRPPRR